MRLLCVCVQCSVTKVMTFSAGGGSVLVRRGGARGAGAAAVAGPAAGLPLAGSTTPAARGRGYYTQRELLRCYVAAARQR